MTKETWHRKLQSIQFYIISFRRMCFFLLFSFCLNIIIGALIYYKYFHRGQHVFYATNGIVSPIKLTARDEPNYSSQALLASPPVAQQPDKQIFE